MCGNLQTTADICNIRAYDLEPIYYSKGSTYSILLIAVVWPNNEPTTTAGIIL